MNALSRAAILAAAAVLLASCSTDSASPSVEVSDAWVKTADEGMTAAFGLVTNTGDHDVTITGAHSDASPMLELHEVVDEVMRPVEGGFVVPAGDALTLEPGGFHIMFMGVPEPIVAGDEIEVTLEFSDGSELTFTATAKDFAGGNEEYEGDMDMDMASPSASMGG